MCSHKKIIDISFICHICIMYIIHIYICVIFMMRNICIGRTPIVNIKRKDVCEILEKVLCL